MPGRYSQTGDAPVTRQEMDSGTEFALQALQGQIKSYTESVNERMREIAYRVDKLGDKLDAHGDVERDWQHKIERNVALAMALGERIETLEVTVGRHHNIFEQTKGAFWMTKVLWAVVGALASTLVWGYAQFVAPSSSTAPAKPVPAQERLE